MAEPIPRKPRIPLTDVPTWALSWALYGPSLGLMALVRYDWKTTCPDPARGFGWVQRLAYAFLSASGWVQGDGYGPRPCYRDREARLAAWVAESEADGGPY